MRPNWDVINFLAPLPARPPGTHTFTLQLQHEAPPAMQAETDDAEEAIEMLWPIIVDLAADPARFRAAVLGTEAAIRAAGIPFLGTRVIPPPVELTDPEP